MDIAQELLSGNRLALSRAITAIENEYDEATDIMKKLYLNFQKVLWQKLH